MSSITAGPRPVQVSPLIKFSRWTFLVTGILYGAYHQRRLSARENARREKEEKERPMREAQAAIEMERMRKAEVKMLEEYSIK